MSTEDPTLIAQIRDLKERMLCVESKMLRHGSRMNDLKDGLKTFRIALIVILIILVFII